MGIKPNPEEVILGCGETASNACCPQSFDFYVASDKIKESIHFMTLKKEGAMTKSIRDVLKNKGASVISISADETVYKALEVMAKENVGALLVINGENLVGILSERDYARKVILEGRSSLKTSVEKIMTDKILYITPDKSVEEGLALMSEKRCRHLPVLEGDKLIGVVSIGDLVKANVAEKEFMISQLENYILSS